MRTLRFLVGIAAAALALQPLDAATDGGGWRADLVYSGGGFWRTRVPVRVENASGEPQAGRLVRLRVGERAGELPLAGVAIESLRVCDERGTEYLFQLTVANPSAAGQHGTFADGDIVCFGVDVGARGGARYFVYADNPDATPVPDSLSAGLVNGSFEEGSNTTPAGWGGGSGDDSWVAQYLLSGGRNNSRCVHIRGSASSVPPRMVRWGQQGILVNEGGRYTLRGWIRANGATKDAGWLIQVNGAIPNPQMLTSRVEGGGPGTYDWREVSASFVVPKGGHTVDVAAVLNGSGEAWYDDVTLVEETSSPSPLRLSVGPPERMEVQSLRGSGAWDPLAGGEWRVRAELRVIRLQPEAAKQTMVTAEIRRAVSMLFYMTNSQRGPYVVRVVDPARKRVLPSAAIGDRVGFLADLSGRGDQRFFVYLAPSGAEAAAAAYAGLVRSSANMVRAADFEDASEVERNWIPALENGKPVAIRGEVSGQGVTGSRAFRVAVPQDGPLRLAGSRQLNLRVRPDATYLYAGYVRTEEVKDGKVDLCGTFLSAEGAPIEGVQRFRTGQHLLGSVPWVPRSGIVTVPADCAGVQLDLGMLAHGAAWFDGILFAEAAEATVAATQAWPQSAPAGDLAVWSVNPMVKLFPDDPPRAGQADVSLFSARNEWEPLQIGVWSRKPLENVRAELSELRHSSGKALPAARSFRVATVDVDMPTAYYCSIVPEWVRRIPRFRNGCEGCAGLPEHGCGWADGSFIPSTFQGPSRRTDGWKGQWPDPLPPLRLFNLAAGQTQGLFFDIFVPEDAAAGQYEGTLTVRAEGVSLAQLPVRLTVWNFALPTERHLRVVYDLGLRGSEAEDPKVLRQWYQFLAEHRISPDSMRPMPVFSLDEKGQVKMDAARFDEMAPYYFDQLGMNFSYMPRSLYGIQWEQPLRPFMGFLPRTAEYEKAFKDVFRMFLDHVTKRGWRDKFVYYVSDEPIFQQQHVVEDLHYIIGLAREVAPDIPVYSSTWAHCPALDGYVTLWGIAQYGGFPVDVLREREKAGDRALFTTDGQQALDTPYLATERLLPVYCFKYGVSGHEFWGVSRWSVDVWQRAWQDFLRHSHDGKLYYWIRYPNGDGYLTYPGEPVGVEGPVSSLRLKAVREGSEDYEYYLLLDRAIGDARKRGANVAAAERALDEVRALVEIPNRGGFYSTEIMPDPEAVYRARRHVAEEIVRLRRE